MERTKEAGTEADEGKLRWKKIGGGSFRMSNGRIIKPNQIFMAHPDEVPKGVRDVVIPLDDLPEEEFVVAPVQSTVYDIVERGTKGWFDVVEPVSGKALNESALRRAAAEELIAALE